MVLSVSEKTFTQDVLESSTPVLVYFWAPWCGLCRVIEPLLTRLQAEWGGQLKVVGINADQNLKLANTYRLRSLPTFIFFVEGKMVHRLENFHGRDDLQKALSKIMLTTLVTSA